MWVEWENPYWLLGCLASIGMLLLALRLRLLTGRTPFPSPSKSLWIRAYLPTLTIGSMFALGCIAAAEPILTLPVRPRWGCPDFWLIWDVSRSMRATDTPPERRFFALRLFHQFLDSLESYDLHPRIGLIAFAAQPYAILPLTADREALRISLEQTLRQDLGEGTNLSATLEAAWGFTGPQSVWLIVSDGAHNFSLSTALEAIAQTAAEQKIIIHTLLIGKESDQFQPEALKLLSKKTGGTFQHNKLQVTPMLKKMSMSPKINLAPWILLAGYVIGLLGIVAMGILGWFNVLAG
ncbi:MAG: VWA domain-containing protein [Bacteroidia bacterium]|nr:VWA domain-containing protein [Bacteroidia bacterium]MDW8236379.1 VWA domain-containing protein [Bacteroidia bacterium]